MLQLLAAANHVENQIWEVTMDTNLQVFVEALQKELITGPSGNQGNQNDKWSTSGGYKWDLSKTEYRSHSLLDSGLYQKNIIEFLKEAFTEGYEITLTPDVLWCVLIYEVAGIIAASPESYRNLFTASKERVKIEIHFVNRPQDLSTYIGEIIKVLRRKVPDQLADNFLLPIEGDTEAELALHAAFANVCKHYYGYQGWQGCQGSYERGKIPKVHLNGPKRFWQMLLYNWDVIGDRISKINPGRAQYFADVSKILEKLGPDSDQEFLCSIYSTFGGWINTLVSKGTSSQMAQVPYVGTTDGHGKPEFMMLSGLFSRELKDRILTPRFGHVIFEVIK